MGRVRQAAALGAFIAAIAPSVDSSAWPGIVVRDDFEIELTLEEVIEPWLGTPYHWALAEKQVGADCSGFTKAVLEEGFVVDLPRSSREQFRVGRAVRRDQLVPGDLVFFDTKGAGDIEHVGIYMGESMFVHASRSRGVVYEDLRFFPGTYRGARRVVAAPARPHVPIPPST